jgi:hypothetical protein
MYLRSADAENTGLSAFSVSARSAKTHAIAALYTGFSLSFRI